jgi:hypothetical protein
MAPIPATIPAPTRILLVMMKGRIVSWPSWVVVIHAFVVTPVNVVVIIEAPEGKEVIVVVKLVESEDVEDAGDPPPIGTNGRPDVEDEGDPPPTGRPDVWSGMEVLEGPTTPAEPLAMEDCSESVVPTPDVGLPGLVTSPETALPRLDVDDTLVSGVMLDGGWVIPLLKDDDCVGSWFGDSVGGNVAIEVTFEDWASNEDPVLGAEDGGATTPPDKVLDNKDPVLDAADWDKMIDEAFSSVVVFGEIKLTELPEGDCNTGLDAELELIPLEGDCEIEGPDGEPGPRPIVLLEVDCKAGGDWGINVWPGSVLAVLLKDDVGTAGDWGIVWPASVLTLLVTDDDVADTEVPVEVVILAKEVDVEDGDSETQSTWPIERSQFESSVGLKA